jgi:DNA-binding NarL/FixJ family response regulator
MTPDQVGRAVTVAATGEPVAPRELLQHLIANDDPVDLNILSPRQKEILGFVVDGLSNAQIAGRLYLSESTVKQHLRATYKLLGVKNRTEAARLLRNSG